MSQGFTKGIPIDTDVTLSADSDFLISSQRAVKAYVDALEAMILALGYIQDGDTLVTGLIFPNTGLKILDTGLRPLTLRSVDTFTAPRTLSFLLNDADKQLTISASADISGTNTGDQTNITGNSGTATALQTARVIGGTLFDGTADIDILVIRTQNDAADTTCFLVFTNDSGTVISEMKTNTGLLYNAATNAITATTFTGALSGNATTATTATTATAANTVNTSNEAADTTCFLAFFTASGTQTLEPKNNTALTFNSSTGALGATSFVGLTPVESTTTSTSTSLTFTSAHYGFTVFWSPAGGAAGTLPANGAAAGSWFEVMILTNQTCTISAATVDTLITVGDLTADSVAFSTANQKVGACVRFTSNGTSWIAHNRSVGCTMTIAT